MIKPFNDALRREHLTGLFYFLIFLSMVPMQAEAGVLSTLNNFLAYLTGDVGKVVATLAVVGVSYACFAMGKVPKLYVITTVIGIGILFGAHSLVSKLAGS